MQSVHRPSPAQLAGVGGMGGDFLALPRRQVGKLRIKLFAHPAKRSRGGRSVFSLPPTGLNTLPINQTKPGYEIIIIPIP